MLHSRGTMLACFTAAALSFGQTVHLFAAPVTFSGGDPGVGPGGARPNSDAAAASYAAAASGLGALTTIDFESVPLGNFANLGIGAGVTASLTGTDPAGGIRTTPTYFGGSVPNDLGYNTTVGGERFLGFVPQGDVGTAILNLAFASPIQAFGVYVTGLETTIAGDLHLVFNDGSAQDLEVVGNSGGGVQFFGFTDAGAQITNIELRMLNVSGTRDIIAVDDVSFVDSTVPEPSAIALVVLGGGALAALRFRRQSR